MAPRIRSGLDAPRLLGGLLAGWLACTLLVTLAPFWPLRAAPRAFAAASRLGAWDFVLNIVLFLPCGALLRRLGTRVSTATAAAALLSLAVESAQMFIPPRYPSQLDVFANAAGALLGAIVAARSGMIRARWEAASRSWSSRGSGSGSR